MIGFRICFAAKFPVLISHYDDPCGCFAKVLSTGGPIDQNPLPDLRRVLFQLLQRDKFSRNEEILHDLIHYGKPGEITRHNAPMLNSAL